MITNKPGRQNIRKVGNKHGGLYKPYGDGQAEGIILTVGGPQDGSPIGYTSETGNLVPDKWMGISITEVGSYDSGSADVVPFTQFPGVDSIIVSWAGYGNVTYDWSTSRYIATGEIGLYNFLNARIGEDIKLKVREAPAPLTAPIFAGSIADSLQTVLAPMAFIETSINFATGGTVASYNLTNHPSWMSINSNGRISGTPNQEGTWTGITVTGTNTAGDDTGPAGGFTVEAQAVPVFFGAVDTPRNYEVDVPIISYDVATNFSSGGTVKDYSFSVDVPGIIINSTTGNVSGTPTEIGSTTRVVIAANDVGSAQSNNVQTIVSAALLAPVFAGTIPDQISTVGQPFVIDVNSYFTTGGAPATFTLANEPSWMTVTADGLVGGTPDAEAISSGITVTANNTSGSDTSNGFEMDAQAAGGRNVLAFNGVDSYALFTLIPLTGAYNISFSVKLITGDLVTTRNLLSRSGSSNGKIGLIGGDFMNIRSTDGTGNANFSDPPQIAIDTWYELTASWDNSTLICTFGGTETLNDSGANWGLDDLASLAFDTDFAHIMIKDVSIEDVAAGKTYFWAINSGSIVSEESTGDPNTLTFFNVLPGDWSVE